MRVDTALPSAPRPTGLYAAAAVEANAVAGLEPYGLILADPLVDVWRFYAAPEAGAVRRAVNLLLRANVECKEAEHKGRENP